MKPIFKTCKRKTCRKKFRQREDELDNAWKRRLYCCKQCSYKDQRKRRDERKSNAQRSDIRLGTHYGNYTVKHPIIDQFLRRPV